MNYERIARWFRMNLLGYIHTHEEGEPIPETGCPGCELAAADREHQE